MNTSPVPEKTCTRCRQSKPLDQFWHANKAKGTLQSRCKPCHLAAQDESRLRHLDGFHARKNAERRRLREHDPALASEKRRAYRLAAIARDPEGMRAKQREHHHRYYIQHREEHIAKTRAYQAAHRDHLNACARQRRVIAGDEIRAKEAAKRERNRDAYRAIAARYRANRQDGIRERLRLWQRAHPERKMVWVRNRRAQLAGASGHFTAAEWRAIKAKQDHTCASCGRREPEIKLTIDHKIPVSKGGSNWATNIQGLCGSCNSSKGHRVHHHGKS